MKKVFVGGSRKISKLNNVIKSKIDLVIKKEYTFLVGDAEGADKSIQTYLFEKNYNNVLIYCTGTTCRNNKGNWKTVQVSSKHKPKTFEYYVEKDIRMAQDADGGIMLWDSESCGTLNNILNLLRENKVCLVYLSTTKKIRKISKLDELRNILLVSPQENLISFEKKLHLSKTMDLNNSQLHFAI